MERTPHFVRWTLARTCPLREATDITSPDQTERQLRVLRAYADALAAGRCHEGICSDASGERGFFAAEVLSAYGGGPLVESVCGNCPANPILSRGTGNLAGCFGWLVLTDNLTAQLEHALAARAIDTGTSPRWYGLWLERAPAPGDLDRLADIWDDTFASQNCLDAAAAEFRHAVAIGRTGAIPLYWSLSPEGFTDGVKWTVASHCRRCAAGMAHQQRLCAVCGFVGRPEPERVRKARGRRPYLPLARILGPDRAAEYARRYRVAANQVE